MTETAIHTIVFVVFLLGAWVSCAGLFALFVKGGTDREWHPGDQPEDWWKK